MKTRKNRTPARRNLEKLNRALARPTGLERLEDRTLLTTFQVLNANDSGAGSLRQAICDANAVPGADTITFGINGGGSAAHIVLSSALPDVTEQLTVDGLSQGGTDYTGSPLVVIGAGTGTRSMGGLTFTADAAGSTIVGLALTNFKVGLTLGGDGNTVQHNYIGLDPTGLFADDDESGNETGVVVTGAHNTIGGATPGAGNVISNNDYEGVVVTGANATIAGNWIGTDANGAALGNHQSGIRIEADGAGTVVGGDIPAARNYIADNALHGVELVGATGVRVAGNYIGVFPGDQGGDPVTLPLGNHTHGVQVSGDGTAVVVEDNVISANDAAGVALVGARGVRVVRNYIGTDIDGLYSNDDLANKTGVEVLSGSTGNDIGAAGNGNVISGNDSDGVSIIGSSGNYVTGNFIGTDKTGKTTDEDLGNEYSGVALVGGATGNVVGGRGAGDGNVIGRNADGILIDASSNNQVLGNFIGVAADLVGGSGNLGNLYNGVTLAFGATGNLIGDAGAGNTIAGNTQNGIAIIADNNTVRGNRIGLKPDGRSLGNVLDGIFINGNGNQIGGAAAGQGNVIANNHGAGVAVANGAGNSIRGNSIADNVGLAIDLLQTDVSFNYVYGVTANGTTDANVDPNHYQPHPTITAAQGGQGTLEVLGTFDAAPNTTYTLDLYASTSAHGTGFGDGEHYLGQVTVLTNAAGHATFDTTFTGVTVGYAVVTATATSADNGTSEFSNAQTISPPVTPAPVASTTHVTSSKPLSKLGEYVTFTAEVLGTAGGPTPTGSVVFTFSDGTAVPGGPVTLVNGKATVVVRFTSVGSRTLTATYSGDAAYLSSAGARNQDVDRADTTTTLTSSSPSKTVGQQVTFTATVAIPANLPQSATGTVSFYAGQTLLGTSPVVNGVATLNTSDLAVGSHAITATYNGDSNFTESTSAALPFDVTKANSTTHLATPGPVTVGNPVTLTATVYGPAGLPVTGTVAFFEGSTRLLGTVALDADGRASITLTFDAASTATVTHTITAVYSGNADLNGSSSAPIDQQVDKANSTTKLAPVDAVAGTQVVLSAHVTGGYGSIAGEYVYFFDGATQIGRGTLDAGGNAVLPWTFKTAGAHPITAKYNGNANVNPSTDALSLDVDKAASRTVVTLPATVTVGAQVTITATVSDLVGITVDGTVTFYDGHTPIRTVTLANGVATFTYTFTTSGPHDVTATYGGNANLESSTDTLAKSVNVADTTTTLTSSANPSTVGNNVTLTAHVTGGYGGLTGGTVIFMEGGAELDRATVDADGNATVTYRFDTVGGHQVTAIFVAFGESAASASSPLNQVVNAASTTTTLTGPVTSTAGQSVTFTATVGVLGSTLTPAGVVKFYDGSTLLGTVSLTGNAASLTLSTLTGGSHTITAVYVSSAPTHTGSTSDPLTHSVTAVSTDVPFKASGRTLRDTTGNGLSSDDTALANVRVNIFKDSNNNGVLDASDALFTFVTTNSSGLFTLDITPAGLYFAQEVTPSGYLQTGPVSGYYKFTASVNNSTTSLDFSNWKQCDCCDDVVNITYIINGTTRVNDLRGNTNPGDVVQAVFTVPAGHSPITVSLVSYTAPSGVWDATVASQQKIWEQQTGTFGPGTYTLTVNLPESFYQVDFVCGPVIDQLGPVGSNIFYSAQNRLFSADNDGALAYVEGTSSISGYVYNDLDNDGVRDANEPGIAGVKVLLSGNNGTSVWATTDARGRYAFANVQPGDYTITETQPAGYLNGKETPSNVFSSVKITTARGSRTGYNFGELAAAKLSGFVYVDKNNDGVKQSTEKGLAGVTMRLLSGTTVVATTTTDSTGAYTFSNVAAGAYAIVESQPANYVDGIETAGTLGGYDQGDNNTISSINVASGAVGTNYNFGELPESFVTTGETATIGFWQNKNGQNLIKSFNGSATCKTLAKWLAQTFPNLYGGSSPNSLVGKNNNDVAALFIKLFNVSGQKLDAQVLGVALAVYSTTNSLGGTAAAKYGFTVDAIGTGNRLYNIGGNGAAFGVANNTNMAVIDILDAANDRAVNGVLYNGNTTLRNMANVVFTGINEQGDI